MDYLLTHADFSRIHISVALFLGVLVFILYQGKLRERVATSMVVAWIFIVLSFTILSRDAYEGIHLNLIPFWQKRYLSAENRLNIFLLLPIGFLLPLLKKKWWQVFLIGFFCTFSVEFIQYITRTGWFDINDLILNEAGVVIGWAVWKVWDLFS